MRIPFHAEERRNLHGGRAARVRRSADNAADALFGDGLPALRLSNPAGDSRPPRNIPEISEQEATEELKPFDYAEQATRKKSEVKET